MFKELRTNRMFKLGKNVSTLLRILDQVEQDSLFFQVEISKQVCDISRVGLGKEACKVRIGSAPDSYNFV